METHFSDYEIRLAKYILEHPGEMYHVGVGKLDGAPGRGSGRYELGSGENPNQHGSGDLLTRIEKLAKEGYSEVQIATMLKIHGPTGEPSTDQLRKLKATLKEDRRMAQISKVNELKSKGYSNVQIGQEMGLPESTVRYLLKSQEKIEKNSLRVVADYLKAETDKYGMLDVGSDTELFMPGVSKSRKDKAIEMLKQEGYELYKVNVEQATNPGNYTLNEVLCVPGTQYKEAYQFDKVHSLAESDMMVKDGGLSIGPKFEYPSSVSSDRVAVVYDEQGGTARDGLIEIRPGVADLSLDGAHYSQVRILVDGTHYLKGMAVYSDRVPEGCDILFNTNKHEGTPLITDDPEKKCVLKPITSDPDNPFGSALKEVGGQTYYPDPNGKYTDPVTGEKVSLSAINKRADEGDWGRWGDMVPSQMLSKQTQELAKQQTDRAYQDKVDQMRSIMELENPTLKKKMLIDFADECDRAAVDLKAAAFPRAKYQVILPIPSLKDNEIYAPNYRDGEEIALVRFPHQSVNEIPILRVNNKNAEGQKIISPLAKDAVGINMTVANRLSGADFDGDTVMVIPTNNGKTKILSRPILKELDGFDPKAAYPPREGMKVMTNKGLEMGKITNLITDMTLQAASDDKLARAIKHAQVVIDAEKHKLDYTRSFKENRIDELMREFQEKENGRYGGATTLISKAKSPDYVPKREGSYRIDPETGEKIWKTASPSKLYREEVKPVRVKDPNKKNRYLRDENGDFVYETDPATGKVKYEKTGKIIENRTEVPLMSTHADARDLISKVNHPMEHLYANYANQLKALGNQARLESIRVPLLQYNKEAYQKYKPEVNQLMADLNESKKNRVRERAAQRMAASVIKTKRAAYKEAGLTKDEIKEEMDKERQRALTAARTQVGAHRHEIPISDRQWEAIQSGAVHDTTLKEILTRANPDRVRELATPKTQKGISDWKQAKIKSMAAQGYTMEQIANSVGVSTSTVNNYL